MPYKVDLVQNKVYFPFTLGCFTSYDITVRLLKTQLVKEKVTKTDNVASTKKVRQFDILYHNWSRKVKDQCDFMN